MSISVASLEDLSIGYRSGCDSRVVVKGLNAELRQGALTCLLGVNGVGKSTLLRTLAGFCPPLAGVVRLRGKAIGDYSHSELSKLVSVVLTDRIDIRNMSVSDIVALGRSPYTGFWGALSRDDRESVDSALRSVGILSLKDRLIQTLSDGERQKTMIAKALAQQTPVILLDEPTAFLDFPAKVETMRILRRFAHTLNRTVLLSTHDVELSLQLADELWLMSSSEGITQGTPEALSNSGRIAGLFSSADVIYDAHRRQFRISVEE